MDLGAFTSGLLTGLREGVEAALILAIICAYLAKTGNQRYFPNVFVGAGLALGLSAVIGIVLFATVGSFDEPYEQLFEGLTMILAASVVTWMLFWMRRQAASVRGELHSAVDRALDNGSVTALVVPTLLTSTLSSNSTTTVEAPSRENERIVFTPLMVLATSSTRRVISCSTASAEAPG